MAYISNSTTRTLLVRKCNFQNDNFSKINKQGGGDEGGGIYSSPEIKRD